MPLEKRYPTADQPLNYEHVLFNHLESMSFFIAQGTADLMQMIEIYEQLATPKTNNEERDVLRKFKLIMSELRDVISAYYDDRMGESQIKSNKPEFVIQRIAEEKEEVLRAIEDIYYKLLLRYLVVVTKRRTEIGESRYRAEEFWEDLRVALKPVLPFDVQIIDDILKSISKPEKAEKVEKVVE